MSAHRITIEARLRSGRAASSTGVYFGDSLLIEDTGNPEFEACSPCTSRHRPARGLARGRGLSGNDRADIERRAARTVKENEKIGPQFAAWALLPENLGSDAVPTTSH